MTTPLKLSAIDQEHLQELYNAAGVARDELPYTEKYEEIWQGFQDRTFKNATRDQLFGALLKYTKSSSNSATDMGPNVLNEDQQKQLKALLPRYSSGGKLLPYSDSFEAALKEFNKHAGTTLAEKDFWYSICRSQSGKRKPPTRTKAVVAKVEDDSDEDGE